MPTPQQPQPHGTLTTIVDSQRRTLRPIGATAAEIAQRTEDLLAGLVQLPSVEVFRGTRPSGTDLPPTAHAIAAGRSLILVEGVSWPSGLYRTDARGRVFCDDLRTGQSTWGLRESVRHWRQLLAAGHRVSAVVVVHRIDSGPYVLPAQRHRDVAWTFPEDAVRVVQRRIPNTTPLSGGTLAALLAALPEADGIR